MKHTHDLFDIQLSEVSLVDRPANQGAEVVLFKRDEGAAVTDKELAAENEVLKAAAAVATAQINALTKAFEKEKTEKEKMADKLKAQEAETSKALAKVAELTPDDSPLAKALAGVPDNIRAEVEKSMGPLLKQQAETSELLKKFVLKEEQHSFIAKAATFANLPVAADTFGPVLYRLSKNEATAEDIAEVERVLAAANSGVAKGSKFKVVGKNDGGAGPSESLAAAAAEIKKGDSKLSDAEAVTKALEANPELYDEYLASK